MKYRIGDTSGEVRNPLQTEQILTKNHFQITFFLFSLVYTTHSLIEIENGSTI